MVIGARNQIDRVACLSIRRSTLRRRLCLRVAMRATQTWCPQVGQNGDHRRTSYLVLCVCPFAPILVRHNKQESDVSCVIICTRGALSAAPELTQPSLLCGMVKGMDRVNENLCLS